MTRGVLWLWSKALSLGIGKTFSAEGLGSSGRVFRWIVVDMTQDEAEMAAAVSPSPLAEPTRLDTLNPPDAGPRDEPCA